MFWLWTLRLLAESEESAISTIIIRGSTDNLMDDMERALDDGINTFKALTKVHVSPFTDGHILLWFPQQHHQLCMLCLAVTMFVQDGRLVAGAGAFEIELAKQLTSYSEASTWQIRNSMAFCQHTPWPLTHLWMPSFASLIFATSCPVDVSRLRAICHSQVCRCLGVGSPSSGRECRHEGVSNLLHMPCSVPAQDIPEAMHFALKWYIFRNQNMQNVLIGLTLADAHFHFFTWIYFVDTWVCPTFFSCATPLPAGHLRVISAVRGSWGGQSDCRTQCLGEGLSHSRGWTMAMGNSY